MKLLLDTPVLARLCHPARHRDVQAWLHAIVTADPPTYEVAVSALSVYELRVGLKRRSAQEALDHLDAMIANVALLPVTASAAARAADLSSLPSGQDVDLSDTDLLLVAQALDAGAVLVTLDQKLARFAVAVGLDVRDCAPIAPTNSNANSQS